MPPPTAAARKVAHPRSDVDTRRARSSTGESAARRSVRDIRSVARTTADIDSARDADRMRPAWPHRDRRPIVVGVSRTRPGVWPPAATAGWTSACSRHAAGSRRIRPRTRHTGRCARVAASWVLRSTARSSTSSCREGPPVAASP